MYIIDWAQTNAQIGHCTLIYNYQNNIGKKGEFKTYSP